MDWLQIAVLAVVQGITEYLPISSSGHLILVPVVTDWTDQGLAMDIAVHVGSLVAVALYFRADLVALVRGGLASLAGREAGPEGRLAWLIVLATVPVGLAGLTFKDFIEAELRSPLVIAWASIGFGVLLWLADRWGHRLRNEGDLGWRGALLIGLFQALALIPGTSRSGITMTAGLLIGLDRQASARFSFLLAVPVIVLSGMLQTIEFVQSGQTAQWAPLAAAALLAAASAYLCIHLFLQFVARIGMTPFVLYRIVLGVILLAVFAV